MPKPRITPTQHTKALIRQAERELATAKRQIATIEACLSTASASRATNYEQQLEDLKATVRNKQADIDGWNRQLIGIPV